MNYGMPSGIPYLTKSTRPKGMNYGVPLGYALFDEVNPPEGNGLRCALGV